jgi:ankyrin repeat protein
VTEAPDGVASVNDRLVRALLDGDLETIQALVAVGIDLEGEYEDATVLKFAARNCASVDVIKILVDAGAGHGIGTWYEDRAPLACSLESSSHPDVVRLLLEAGADVHGDGSAYAPLHRAVSSQPASVVIDCLLAAGAEIEVREEYDGLTPLLLAAEIGATVAARHLVARGADVDARDAEGMTPLMHAVVAGDGGGMVSLLVQAGADVNARDDAGTTPLLYATANVKERETIRLLVQAGADGSARDAKGVTTLMHFVGRPMTLDDIRLICAGAPVDRHDFKGMTALMHAARLGDASRTIPLLAGAGANLEARDRRKLTALLVPRSSAIGTR